MTKNQDSPEDRGVASFYNVGPIKRKKKKKQHADKEAGKISLIDEHQNVNLYINGSPSPSDKRHMKKKRRQDEAMFQDSDILVNIEHSILEPESHKKKKRRHEAKFQDCDMLVNIEYNILEPESHHGLSEQSVAVRKRNDGQREDNDWEGSIDDAVNENDRVHDECFFHVKKHKKHKKSKRKGYSEMEDTCASISEDCVADTLEVSSKIKKRHKKSKDKHRTVTRLPCVSEIEEVGDLDFKNLEMFTEKENYGENVCHPKKERKGFVADAESSKIKKRHKKSKDKHRTVETLPCLSEIGEVGDLDSKNLEMFIEKENYADNACHPKKEREDFVADTLEESSKIKKRHKKSKDKHRTVIRLPCVSEIEEVGDLDFKNLEIFTEKENYVQNECRPKNKRENCVSDTFEESSKIKKRHKKSKGKHITVEKLPSVSEIGDVGDLNSKNLEMFTDKENYAENECRPKKNRKNKPKEVNAEDASAEQEQTAFVLSNSEMNGCEDSLGQNKQSTELAYPEGLLKTKQAHKSSKHRIENTETVEVPLSAPTTTSTADPGSLSDERSEEQFLTHERSDESESIKDGPCDVLADEPARETALKLLEEFIPNIRTMSQSMIRSLINYDLQRFLQFKEQGIPIRFGRFTAEENEQLRHNMEAYLELTEIDSADKVFHPFRYPEEAKAIQEAKMQHSLHHYIGRGIARPWILVKCRARKIFDRYNYKGRYSVEEIEELRRYQATYGNNWRQISNRMARSNLSVALKFSQLRNPINQGSWSKEEMKRLVQAVQQFLQNTLSHNDLENVASTMEQRSTGEDMSMTRDKLYKGISWIEVEAKVGTRNWMQCKLKWSSFLTKKMTRGANVYHGQMSLLAKIRLIQRLYESRVEDSSDLDWEELAECIGNVPPSYVQRKFYRLKSCYVPSWHTKTFTEIVDCLHDVLLPKLESKVKENKTGEEMPREELQRLFKFADIFEDSDLDDSDLEDQ